MGRTFLIAIVLGVLPQSPVVPPRVAPEHTPSTTEEGKLAASKEDVATILQSGSTNIAAYKVVIHHDGSATAEVDGAASLRTSEPRSQQFSSGTLDTQVLLRLLREIGDVSKIPTGACAKSVSFGTRTQIVYAGKTSGDLQCIRQQAADSDQQALQAAKDLSNFVQSALGQLRINVRRVGSN